MTPARRDKIVSLVQAVAQHRGRTVAPIREGGSFDGRAIVEQDEDGFSTERKPQ